MQNNSRKNKSKRTPRPFPPRGLLIAVVLLLFLTAVIFIGPRLLPEVKGAASESTGTENSIAATTSAPAVSATPTPTEPTEIRVTLTGVGDIILHQAVIDGGLINPGEKPAVYDYTPIFQYVKPIFDASTLAMANYEGTLNGAPYSGYPFFCAPDAIADALYSAGIQTVWTANNHTIDRGLDGVIRTATVFREKGFQVIGTRPDETSPSDAVIDVGGIKVGVLAYTFETIGTEQTKTLNGNTMPAAADPLIDSFNPDRKSSYIKDLAAMLERVAALRQQGAELICLSLHWGIEYQTHSSGQQREMAQQLADAGVELIIGHHPHVIEEIQVLTSATTGKPTLVYYSVGNFLHNMDFNTHNTSGNAQDSVIARITLVKNTEGVKIEKGEYIPTYVVRVLKGSQLQHLIVPVLPGLADPDAYQTTTSEMQASLKRIEAILENSTGTAELPIIQAGR